MKRLALGCALFSLVLSCKSDSVEPRTEVLLQIDAERLVKLSAERLVVELLSGPKGSNLSSAGAPEEFDLTSEDFNWPASLALLAKPGHETHVFEIAIDIEANGKRVARSKVRSSFIKHQTLVLKTLLYGECLGFLDCNGDQTCVAPEGRPRCDDAAVDANTLPAFGSDGNVGQPAANGGKPGSAGMSGRAAGGAGAGAKAGAGGSEQPEAGSGGSSNAESRGGQGGSQNAGTGAAGSGGAPACGSTGPEQCDTGLDDDCNGQVDCADPACAQMQCVPNGTVVGVMVPETAACPSGYDNGEQLVHRGLMDRGCGGCSCTPSPTMCTPWVYFYPTSTACTADTTNIGGTQVMAAIPLKPGCSSGPIGASISMDTPPAWRVKVAKSPDACSSAGTAMPLPPTWTTNMKLCATTSKRNGCEMGYACVPKTNAGKICAQREVASCPASTTLETWQREFTDDRTCGACGCAAQGGSCSNIVVSLGHDWSCNSTDSSLRDGEKACNISTYAPPASYAGTPVNPTCTAGALVSGMVKPSMPLDLCCLE